MTQRRRFSAWALLFGLTCAHPPAAASGYADLPLVDIPYNTYGGGAWPSMAQSLRYSNSSYAYVHDRIGALAGPDSPRARLWLTLGFDFFSEWLPLGNGWLHEEWHRAVMSHYGIASYDEIYDLKILASTIAVSHVADDDLARLKREHPADFVRLAAAGFEAQSEQNLAIERNQFFHQLPTDNLLLLWSNALNNYFYFDTCATTESNRLTDEFNTVEGRDVPRRDFTGLDCNAWVYDLFRPNEDYAARGAHPSGVGVNRYRALRDLNNSEASYLKAQRNWMLINLIDPFLFSRQYFATGDVQWNANLRHHVTPFGDNLGVNFFWRSTRTQGLCTANVFRNQSHVWPGLSCELFELPVGASWRVDARAAAWGQPEAQSFYANHANWGGLLGLHWGYRATPTWEPYIETEAKTAGWVPGIVELGSALSLRLGLIARY